MSQEPETPEYRYERQDAGGGDWEEVTEEYVRTRLAPYHEDVDLVIEGLRKDGLPCRTPFAFYRAVRVD